MRQGERASALRAGLLLGAFWRKKQENAVGPAGHGPRHRGTQGHAYSTSRGQCDTSMLNTSQVKATNFSRCIASNDRT